MKKEIEPGCLCLAYDPNLTENQQCIARRFVAKGSVCDVRLIVEGTAINCNVTAKQDLWLLDDLVSYADNVPGDFAAAKFLMRIDGGSSDKELEQDKELEHES